MKKKKVNLNITTTVKNAGICSRRKKLYSFYDIKFMFFSICLKESVLMLNSNMAKED